ncbi:MAG: flagellin protein [Firmicutes bacterium]|nr:flagellin protein [Bacillota bacterium]
MAQADITRIASNIAGLNSLNALNSVNTKLGIHQLRLATGKRINEAADDPAGLTIATKFNAKSRGLGVALDNIGDAKNLLSVAEAGLTKINDILLVVRDKAEQAANDALGVAEREAIRKQIDELLTEIDKIVDETEWNGTQLIDGTADLKFQTGYLSDGVTPITLSQAHDAQELGVNLEASLEVDESTPVGGTGAVVTEIGLTDVTGTEAAPRGEYTIKVDWTKGDGTTTFAKLEWKVTGPAGFDDIIGAIGGEDATGHAAAEAAWNKEYDFGCGFKMELGTKPSDSTTKSYKFYFVPGNAVDSNGNATAYMSKIDDAIATVSDSIAKVGASVSRLTFKEETLVVAKINTEAAYSRIMNADMAAEQLEATKLQILQQTATAMLAQANVAPQAVLALFR